MVSGMPKPPWEPPARDNGPAEAKELQLNHVKKQMVSSLETVNQRNRTEAVCEGSEMCMAVADGLFRKLLMQGVEDMVDLDRIFTEAQSQ